jgi:hypothetical protein
VGECVVVVGECLVVVGECVVVVGECLIPVGECVVVVFPVVVFCEYLFVLVYDGGEFLVGLCDSRLLFGYSMCRVCECSWSIGSCSGSLQLLISL